MQEIEPHPGSVDTLKTLSSGGDGLERYRIFEDLGKYLLNGIQGDILEIGVGESSYFLTKIAKKFNRRLYHCDVAASKIVNPLSVPGYLSDKDEITYFEEKDPIPENLKRVVCYAGTSDSLFERMPLGTIALAFIDGDHSYAQARRDFWHIWPLLSEHGIIFLHDTFPPTEEWTTENLCGDVWRLRRELELDDDMDVFTFTRGLAIGVGLTMVRKREKERKPYH